MGIFTVGWGRCSFAVCFGCDCCCFFCFSARTTKEDMREVRDDVTCVSCAVAAESCGSSWVGGGL